MWTKRRRRGSKRLAAVAVGVLVFLAPVTAHAALPEMSPVGDPTPAEAEVIEDTWSLFAESFDAFADCMGPIEVDVVARAEDVYGTGSSFPIAAFYQFPPEAKVFVEHGKVEYRILLHEFAHHLDISCGLGEGPLGDRFRSVQGIAAKQGWLQGPRWSDVPAENFAEAVVAYFGEEPKVAVGDGALSIVADLVRMPDPVVRARNAEAVAEALEPLRSAGPGDPPIGVFPGMFPVAV